MSQNIYPSLEDMGAAHMIMEQMRQESGASQAPYPTSNTMPAIGTNDTTVSLLSGSLYPSLDEYMGVNLSSYALEPVPENQQRVLQSMRAPITVANEGTVGLLKAQVTHGVKKLVLCKDGNGKIGMRVRSVNKGVFVSLVVAGGPAALVGLRFGDQVLQINGENVAGWDTDKAMKKLKQIDGKSIEFAVRDRPFERNVTLTRDSGGHLGFLIKNGTIQKIVKDSSAARNGLLVDHQLLEVNGQNVIGLKDKEIYSILEAGGRSVTITIMPTFLYDKCMKAMASDLVKNQMDHSA